MSELESAWQQLREIYDSGRERKHRRHEVICGECHEPVLIVWETDPLVFRISQRRGFESPAGESTFPELNTDETRLRRAVDKPLHEVAFDLVGEEGYAAKRKEYLRNARSKAWDRPRLCDELLEGAMAQSTLDLTCRCAQPLPVDMARLVVDVETRVARRTVTRPQHV